METRKDQPIKIFNTISVFALIYIFPLVLSYLQTGPSLVGDKYQIEISYIKEFSDLIKHFADNFKNYLNVFSNPIFWFFVSAYLTQKTIRWINS